MSSLSCDLFCGKKLVSGISGISSPAGACDAGILPVTDIVLLPGDEIYSFVSAALTVQIIHQVIPALFDCVAGLLEE